MGLNVPVLKSSFELVVEREPHVTERFYRHLFTDFPESKALFTRNDPKDQQRMLTEALVAVMDHLEDAPWLVQTLGALGEKHAGYGVTNDMYDWVGASLLKAFAEVAGDAWNDEMTSAWGEAYGAIAGMMQDGAAKAS